MIDHSLFISRFLWRELRTSPGAHWKRQPQPLYESSALLMAFVLSALALISGMILSALIVSRGADVIAQDHENETFDLLAVTPLGGLGSSWARFASFIHYEFALKNLDRLRHSALGVMLVIVVFTTATLILPALESQDSAALAEAAQWGLFYLFLVPMMYFDHIFAVISGGLISIVVPTLRTPDARVVALVAAATLHLGGYLVAGLTGALILPTIFGTMGIHGWLADLIRPLGALGMFVLVHEMAVLLLYRQAQERLNSFDPDFLPQVGRQLPVGLPGAHR